MKLSVIIPTTGRASLAAAVMSSIGADEVVIVADESAGAVTLPDLPIACRVERVIGGDHGYTARTRGIELATGTHLAFMDDDDVYTPGAIETMRAHAGDVPVIFRMDHYHRGVLWEKPVLEFGNVSTQMFLVPNVPDKLGIWAPHAPGLQEPGGDYTFISGCAVKFGGVVWREEVISTLRPEMPSIAVVTPWLDHPELIDGYMAAMERLSPRDELIVVDNGSSLPLSLPGIRLPENRGFAAASNLGLEAAEADAVLFLNNDVVMTRWDWLANIRAALEPGLLVGADRRDDAHADVDGHSFPYLDGWCLAGMREDLLELGGFDEGYVEPAYFSDNDLCLRARMEGMRLLPVDVGLHHLANRTAGPASDERVRAATLANRERYLIRAREALVAA